VLGRPQPAAAVGHGGKQQQAKAAQQCHAAGQPHDKPHQQQRPAQ